MTVAVGVGGVGGVAVVAGCGAVVTVGAEVGGRGEVGCGPAGRWPAKAAGGAVGAGVSVGFDGGGGMGVRVVPGGDDAVAPATAA